MSAMIKQGNFAKRERKIALILLILSATVAFSFTYGSFDAFYPWNLANMSELIYFGGGDLSITTIGYNTALSIIVLLLGITPETMLVFPICLIPLIVLYFAIFYTITRKRLCVSVLFTIVSTLYITNSTTFLYWIHSVGYVLFLCVVFLFLRYLCAHERSQRNSLFLCIIIVMFSLNYGSYNNNFSVSLFVFGLIGLFVVYSIIQDRLTKNSIVYVPKEQLLIIVILSVFLIFGLNTFYESFFVFTDRMGNEGISIYDKILTFVNNIFGLGVDTTHVLGEYFYESRAIMTPLSILRMVLVCFTIFVYCLWILYSAVKQISAIKMEDIIILASLVGALIFMIIRVFIVHQIAYSGIIFPATLMMARLFSLNIPDFKKRAFQVIPVLFIAITIILTVVSFSTNIYYCGKISSNPGISAIGQWSYSNSENEIASDVYTYGMLSLSVIQQNAPIRTGTVFDKYTVFSQHNDYLPIFNHNNPVSTKDIVLNWKLPYLSMSTSDWVDLKPWIVFAEKISFNPQYNAIYSNGILDYISATK